MATLGAVLLLAGACTPVDTATVSPQAAGEPPTTLAGTAVADDPEHLFPDQVAVPVGVFVGGLVYDLSEVPARLISDLGQASLPYAGGPTVTPHGLLVATGASYDATLLLVPLEGGEPAVLATGVGHYAVSDDGSKVALSQPSQGGDVSTPSQLIEVDLVSGGILRLTEFEGFRIDGPVNAFADVVAYDGSDVLMLTGDGASGAEAAWLPDDRVVLVDEGEDTGVGDPWVSPRGGVHSSNGTLIASPGRDGDLGPPVIGVFDANGNELRRMPVEGFDGEGDWIGRVIWLDDTSLIFLGESRSNVSGPDSTYGIYECADGVTTCRLLQPINFRSLDFGQVDMFGSAADVQAFEVPDRPQ